MTQRADPTPPATELSPSVSPDRPDPLEERLRSALAPNLLVVRPIGAGGMARVFLAREPALKRFVAVKVLSAELAASPEARARFEREAQAVAGLSHPNIVAVHAVGELDDATPYFVMQHVAGRSMAARVEQDGTLPVGEARRALAEVAAALATAHEHGIVHRDIKAANVLHEEATGRSLVSDFGIAAVTSAADPASMRLTGTGMVLGTPMYMSPEQLLAEPVSEKTDIYSLGLLAHELIAGSSPFRARTPNELIAAYLRDTPAPLVARRPEVDDELSELVGRCLAKDAAARPTAAEVALRLAPGGSTLLEWPPPGMESLQGALRPVAATFWLGDALVLVAIGTFILAGPKLGSMATSTGTLLLMLTGGAGAIALIAGAIRGIRLGLLTARARADGYAWMTVLETLADQKRDTGNIIAGSREYSTLDSGERSRFRLLRVWREMLLLGSALSAIPLLLFLIALGSAGIASHGLLWAMMTVPPLFAVAALAVDVREWRTFAAQRRRRATTPRMDMAKLSASWYASFEAARRDQSLGRGRSTAPHAGRSVALIVGAVVVFMGIVLVPLMAVGAVGPEYWLGGPLFASIEQKAALVEVARGYRLPTDSSISPLEAGRAFHGLLKPSEPSPFPQHPQPAIAGEPRPWADSLPAVRPGASCRFDTPKACLLFAAAPPDQVPGLPASTKILTLAARGLTASELAYLERIALAKHWASFSIIARSPRMDYIGARFVVPFPENAGGYWGLPMPSTSTVKNLGYASSARAAYFLARGQRDSAENALRELVSFGFVMNDEGTLLIERLVGIVLVGMGRDALIEYYGLIGDPRGARLKAAIDSVRTLLEVRSEGAGDRSRDPVMARAVVQRMADDPTAPRSDRLEMLLRLASAPCTNVREMVFGPGPEVRESFDKARRNWARFASDSALLDLAFRQSERPTQFEQKKEHKLVRVAQAEGVLLANRRMRGCTALFLEFGRDF